MKAQRGSRGIAVLILDPGASWGWVVSTMPRPLYPRERPGTHCIGGWVGPRAGLDVCEKSSPHRDFFFACPGFFPFDPFLYCLNPFVLHVTLRSMLPSLQHNTNIHAPGEIFFLLIPGFSPLIHLYC
jgi:hypothetical protein